MAGLAAGLASQLSANLRDDSLENWPCVATTVVDIDHLEHSSRFGRALSENLGSEIFRQGGKVFEIRSGRAFYIEPGTGEMVLSRSVDELAGSMEARAVLAGTYSLGANSVSVNIRLINLADRSIISVATAEIARTPAIESMLHETNSPVPTAYDRMP
jgi:TolB-like protein